MLTVTQFQELLAKFDGVTALKSYFESIRNSIDEKITAKETQVDDFIIDANARLNRNSGGSLVCFKTLGGQDTWFYGFGKNTWINLSLAVINTNNSSRDIHEAFLENGTEKEAVWIAAYPLSIKNGEVVSQPNVVPAYISNVEEGIALCANTEISGIPQNAHRMMSVWDYSLLYLWTVSNKTQPIGNNDDGHSSSMRHIAPRFESGVPLTGSMGDASSNTGTYQGIYDLIGNYLLLSGAEIRSNTIYLSEDNGDVLTPSSFISTQENIETDSSGGWDGWASIDTTNNQSVYRSLFKPRSSFVDLLRIGHGDYINEVDNSDPISPFYRGGGSIGVNNVGMASLLITSNANAANISSTFRSAFVL